MSTVQEKKTYTPADLLALPDPQNFELIDGELVARNVGVLSSLVEGIILVKIGQFSEKENLGRVFPASMGVRCFPGDSQKIRRPDVSFLRRDRLAPELFGEGFLTIPPDLAVEVLSPNDLAYEIDEKIEDYLKAGVSLVWVVNPETRIVMIHRRDGSTTKLGAQEELGGENVLPGFRCPVSDLFPQE